MMQGCNKAINRQLDVQGQCTETLINALLRCYERGDDVDVKISPKSTAVEKSVGIIVTCEPSVHSEGSITVFLRLFAANKKWRSHGQEKRNTV